VQRREQRERITKDSVELFQVGIERVQGVRNRTLFQVLQEEKCQGEDTHRFTKYSVGSTRSS
jgi:hypothetical protein